MSSTDFFHGITVSLVETGARIISLPSSSIIGIVDTFTPGLGLVASDLPTLLTRDSEAVAAFGADSAITRACRPFSTSQRLRSWPWVCRLIPRRPC